MTLKTLCVLPSAAKLSKILRAMVIVPSSSFSGCINSTRSLPAPELAISFNIGANES